MAKPPTASPDAIMPIGTLRPMLQLIKMEQGREIGCALVLTADKDAVFLCDKRAKPKRVRTMMVKRAKEIGLALETPSLRFGHATLDDENETTLLIRVNKAPAGAATYLALKKRVKPAGFADVVFTVDETLETELEEDEAAPGTPAAAPPPTAPSPPLAPPRPASPLAPPDPRALTARLAQLISRIQAAPALADELKLLAMRANALIKSGDLSAAAETINTLALRLGQSPATTPGATPGATPAAPPSFITMQKSRLLWDATHKRILAEVQVVKQAIAANLGPDDQAAVARAQAELDEIPAVLDGRLVDALDACLNETRHTEHAVLLQQAQRILQIYADFIATNPLLPRLTGPTPFGATLTIAATATSSLKVLQTSLH